MPALYRITTGARLAVGVIGIYAMVAVIDAVRLHWSAAAPSLSQPRGLAHPWHVRVAYRRQLITGRPRWPSRWSCSPSMGAPAVGTIRAEPGRHRGPTPSQHEPAVVVAGRARDRPERAGNRGGTRDQPVGAAASRVVVHGDRQLGGDDAVPVAHARAAGRAPALRHVRTPRSRASRTSSRSASSNSSS